MLHEQVRRLHITVQYTLAMSEIQGVRRIADQPDGTLGRQSLRRLGEQPGHITAVDVTHRQP